jgi:hypothetical protein
MTSSPGKRAISWFALVWLVGGVSFYLIRMCFLVYRTHESQIYGLLEQARNAF